jgi:PAT family beta-lactamase induction signal transducer AmpG
MSSPSSPFIPSRGPLATRRGRLATFFCLYLTEGIPLGFTAVLLVTQMRRQGLGPAAIGLFMSTLYLPWSWKWLIAPVVDLVYSHRLGRRRAWIVGCQAMMILTLLAAAPVDFVTHLTLLTSIILVHNAFAATMDVAIDALACNTLPDDERGLANCSWTSAGPRWPPRNSRPICR